MSHTDDLIQEIVELQKEKTGKEIAFNIFKLTSNENEEPYERIINIQQYCRGVLNPPKESTEPIEVEG